MPRLVCVEAALWDLELPGLEWGAGEAWPGQWQRKDWWCGGCPAGSGVLTGTSCGSLLRVCFVGEELWLLGAGVQVRCRLGGVALWG